MNSLTHLHVHNPYLELEVILQGTHGLSVPLILYVNQMELQAKEADFRIIEARAKCIADF